VKEQQQYCNEGTPKKQVEQSDLDQVRFERITMAKG
jgi:hypothetical protein